jgi:hypothetical protein
VFLEKGCKVRRLQWCPVKREVFVRFKKEGGGKFQKLPGVLPYQTGRLPDKNIRIVEILIEQGEQQGLFKRQPTLFMSCISGEKRVHLTQPLCDIK